MIAGIGLLGALTAEIAPKLLTQASPDSTGNPEIDHLIERLTSWESLDQPDRA